MIIQTQTFVSSLALAYVLGILTGGILALAFAMRVTRRAEMRSGPVYRAPTQNEIAYHRAYGKSLDEYNSNQTNAFSSTGGDVGERRTR